MKWFVRLGVLAALWVALGIGLVYIRADTACAGNRLHDLYRSKRDLQKACRRLELAVAALKSPRRLREQIGPVRSPADGIDPMCPGPAIQPSPVNEDIPE